MIVNESFLDSATLRENVVSLARNIGYVPRSKTSAKAVISFNIPTSTTSPQIILKAGLICVGAADNTTYTFSIPEDISRSVSNGVASFNNIEIYQGVYLTNQFTVDNSIDQRFILNNSGIDTNTIIVRVGNREYKKVDNITNINSNSEIYLIQEIADEKYGSYLEMELLEKN